MPRNRRSRAAIALIRVQLSSELPSSMKRTCTSQSVRANSVWRIAASYASSPADSLKTGVRIRTFGLPFIDGPVFECRPQQLDQLSDRRVVTLTKLASRSLGHRVPCFRRVHHIEAQRIGGTRRHSDKRVQTRRQRFGGDDDVFEFEAQDLITRKPIEIRPQHRSVES